MSNFDVSYNTPIQIQQVTPAGTQIMVVGPGGTLEVDGTVTVATSTPSSSSAAGTVGTITWDATYVYVCTATNTWKRVEIATW